MRFRLLVNCGIGIGARGGGWAALLLRMDVRGIVHVLGQTAGGLHPRCGPGRGAGQAMPQGMGRAVSQRT